MAVTARRWVLPSTPSSRRGPAACRGDGDQHRHHRSRATSTPAPTWFPRLGMTAGPLLLVVVALAIYVFN
jgi:hypothetical protein